MSIEVKVLEDRKVEDIIYFVKAGDTLSSVAKKFCVDKDGLCQDNDINAQSEELKEGDILWIRRRNSAIHIVKPLETFETISAKYNVTIEHIKKLNNIENLFIGQRLII